MDELLPSVWNLFHDGSVDSVAGSVPGIVTIEVSIPYLRERISEPGQTFTVTLHNCTRFVYRDYDNEDFSDDFGRIADARPGILSASMKGETCVVHGDCGVFEMVAADGSLSVNGKLLLLSDLFQVATSYWEDWKAKSQNDMKSDSNEK